MRHILPGAIRLDLVRLHNIWVAHDYELREEDGTLVFRMEFRV